jgi:hypothetical protein
MATKKRQCDHVLTNGQVCGAIPLRDSKFCYWHHKARFRHRHNDHIAGPISMEGNSGLALPLLEDPNAIQLSIQEIMQAILDRRLDPKRAGLLLYSLQLACSNVRNLQPQPEEDEAHIAAIGSDKAPFNECIGGEDEGEDEGEGEDADEDEQDEVEEEAAE